MTGEVPVYHVRGRVTRIEVLLLVVVVRVEVLKDYSPIESMAGLFQDNDFKLW